MSYGYVIAQINVTDAEAYKEYVAEVTPIVAKFGGEYLIRGGEADVVEGESAYERIVVIRFPSLQTAHDWHDSAEYAPVKKMRQEASTSIQILAAGI